jgi:transcriptional regulator with XRE-family HTH domain
VATTTAVRFDGESLRRLREQRGETREAVAVGAGVSYGTIVKLETGKYLSPHIRTVRLLAEYFGVHIDDLLTESP